MNQIIKRLLLLSLLVLIGIGHIGTAMASTRFNFYPDHKIEAVIGAGEINRIQVAGGDVIEVVGDESKYSLYWSSDWRNLFFTPKVEAGETIEVSLLLAGGAAQDIRFTVGDTTAQTTFIDVAGNAGHKHDRKLPVMQDSVLKKELALMMRAMLEGTKDKYYVTLNQRTLRKDKQMTVKQTRTYRYRDLAGAVLVVQNFSSQTLELNASSLSKMFLNPIATSPEVITIRPRTKGQVFIITRASHE